MKRSQPTALARANLRKRASNDTAIAVLQVADEIKALRGELAELARTLRAVKGLVVLGKAGDK